MTTNQLYKMLEKYKDRELEIVIDHQADDKIGSIASIEECDDEPILVITTY